jgi:hypothetical protein
MDSPMTHQHQSLAQGRWSQMLLAEQMANIGSEVDRAFHWRAKNNAPFCEKAIDRALELLDLSLASAKGFPRLKELARTREALVDYFLGNNGYQSDENSLRKYFLSFAVLVRKNV